MQTAPGRRTSGPTGHRLADPFLALACRQSVGGDAHAVRQLRVVPFDGGDHGINTSGCHVPPFRVEGVEVPMSHRAPLIFANAEIFTDDLLARIAEPREPALETVILDMETVAEVDTTGADALRVIHGALAARGISLLFARATASVLAILRANGELGELGEDHFYPSLAEAVTAHQASRGRFGRAYDAAPVPSSWAAQAGRPRPCVCRGRSQVGSLSLADEVGSASLLPAPRTVILPV